MAIPKAIKDIPVDLLHSYLLAMRESPSADRGEDYTFTEGRGNARSLAMDAFAQHFGQIARDDRLPCLKIFFRGRQACRDLSLCVSSALFQGS
jgi:hypothetical protein